MQTRYGCWKTFALRLCWVNCGTFRYMTAGRLYSCAVRLMLVYDRNLHQLADDPCHMVVLGLSESDGFSV